jgi:hypothetical protein
MVHYTLQDLQSPTPNNWAFLHTQSNQSLTPISLSNPPYCTLGEENSDYNSGAIQNSTFNLNNASFQLGFFGATDLPYSVWASTNLLDWSQIGTATQAAPGCFQFDDSTTTNYLNRFYQVRLP